MPNHRLAIVDKAYVDIAVRAGVCLMDGGRKSALTGLNSGDQVMFYSPSHTHNGVPMNAYTAIGTLGGTQFHKTDWVGVNGFQAWVMPCRFEDVRPLFEPLNYTTPIMDIPAQEFNRIANAMRGI